MLHSPNPALLKGCLGGCRGSELPPNSPLAHMDGQAVVPTRLPPISPRPGHIPVHITLCRVPSAHWGAQGWLPPPTAPRTNPPRAPSSPPSPLRDPKRGARPPPRGTSVTRTEGARPPPRPKRRGSASERGGITHRGSVTRGTLSSPPAPREGSAGRGFGTPPRASQWGAVHWSAVPPPSTAPGRAEMGPSPTEPSRAGMETRTETIRDEGRAEP